MRISFLIEELAQKFDPDTSAGEDVSASAARTALVAQITALDAARAGSVGRGLQLAAEELHELSLLTGSQDQNIRLLAHSAQESVAEVRRLFAALLANQWASVKDFHAALVPAKQRLTLLVCDLVRKISSMPQSLSDYEAPQSADRVQVETLLRQAMINGRDRLNAIEIAIDIMIDGCQSCGDLEKLALLDTEALDASTRQRLAALTRDQSLDERILSSNMSH